MEKEKHSKIRTKLEDELYQALGEGAYKVTDEQLLEMIDSKIVSLKKEERCSLEERISLRSELFYTFRGYGLISGLLNDEEVTEIMVNNDGSIFYEKKGKMHLFEERFENRKKLDDMIQKMVSFSKRKVNEANPVTDCRLPDGNRLCIVVPPVAISAPIVSIRKFPHNPLTEQGLIENGSMTSEIADYLKGLVHAKKNIFIFGGTGSGKTTLLNVLSGYLGVGERIVTIEDSAELQIQHVKNIVKLESRITDDNNLSDVTIRDLIKCALRLRPDRIIVGEVRSGEAFDMLLRFYGEERLQHLKHRNGG